MPKRTPEKPPIFTKVRKISAERRACVRGNVPNRLHPPPFRHSQRLTYSPNSSLPNGSVPSPSFTELLSDTTDSLLY